MQAPAAGGHGGGGHGGLFGGPGQGGGFGGPGRWVTGANLDGRPPPFPPSPLPPFPPHLFCYRKRWEAAQA